MIWKTWKNTKWDLEKYKNFLEENPPRPPYYYIQ
jgi:hypothetical protein